MAILYGHGQNPSPRVPRAMGVVLSRLDHPQEDDEDVARFFPTIESLGR